MGGRRPLSAAPVSTVSVRGPGAVHLKKCGGPPETLQSTPLPFRGGGAVGAVWGLPDVGEG
jgi:hypothetical protein